MPLSSLLQLFKLRPNKPPPSPPRPNHTGLIYRAPLPKNPPSTFPPAPYLTTTAFAHALVCGPALRQRSLQRREDAWRQCVEGFAEWRAQESIDESCGEDGVEEDDAKGGDEMGREGRVQGVDVWEVETDMFVRRKGRGRFRCEGVVLDGWRGGEGEYEEADLDLDVDVERTGSEGSMEERLEDGFEYMVWLDEEEEMRRK